MRRAIDGGAERMYVSAPPEAHENAASLSQAVINFLVRATDDATGR